MPGDGVPRSEAGPSRRRLSQIIPRRPKVGALTSILLSLLFAALYAPVVLIDRWVDAPIVAGQPAPVTVRVPPFAGFTASGVKLHGGGVLIARGELVDEPHAAAAEVIRAATPHGAAPFYAYVAIALALTLLYTLHLGRTNRGRLVRVQVVHLGVVLAVCVAAKIALLLTPLSVLVVPVSLAAVVPTLTYDRTVGLATGVWASILVSFLVPFDVGVSTVLVVQAAAAALLIPERHRHPWRLAATAGLVAALAAALTYGAFHYLSYGAAPFDELFHPMESGWAAAALGGLLALVAVPLIPLYQVLCGEITQGSIIRHGELSHPLLKQIAEKSPGTWQHSLAMANMAEIAANAIGANGRLVRVGAYFHDLGKSLQPKYFIENLEPGEPSPHDRLPPEVSCDAIFAHVTEGIALARKHKLPERIVDFMHMHHGNGVLEYFWAKCQDQGNPKALPQEAFRYPGVPPQSRETAILAICDAVEAASRTLKKPDDRAVASLVQRIVYGKLHLGQLDDSGLSMADLRKISDSLRETIKHAHHGRIEYPWQREEAAQLAAEGAIAETVAVRPARSVTQSQRMIDEPRLDSLDAPRPLWQARPRTEADRDPRVDDAIAATQPSGEQAAVTPSASALMAASAVPAASAAASAAAPAARPGTDVIATSLAVPSARAAARAATAEVAPPIGPDELTPPPPAPLPVAAPVVASAAATAPATAPTMMELPAIAAGPEAAGPARAAARALSRAETRRDPRWAAGLAARVDAALIDPGDPELVVVDGDGDGEAETAIGAHAVAEREARATATTRVDALADLMPAPIAPSPELAAPLPVPPGPGERPAAPAPLAPAPEPAELPAPPAAAPPLTLDAPIELELRAAARAPQPADAVPLSSPHDLDDEPPTTITARHRGPSKPPPGRGPSTAEIAALSSAFAGPPGPERATTATIADGLAGPAAGGPQHRRPPSALEVDGDDIEATIELGPTARASAGGAVIGPPPATRPPRSGPVPVVADDVAPARPPSSMLPPRARGRVRRPDE